MIFLLNLFLMGNLWAATPAAVNDVDVNAEAAAITQKNLNEVMPLISEQAKENTDLVRNLDRVLEQETTAISEWLESSVTSEKMASTAAPTSSTSENRAQDAILQNKVPVESIPTCSASTITAPHPNHSAQNPSVNRVATSGLFIFVSLNMPTQALQDLHREALAQDATLVIRGLKNNNFKETIAALQDLKIGVNIDPVLFRKYQVTTVPTFVQAGDTSFHTLRGNVRLAFAMEKFKAVSP
jgi:type-F conjugative transfer system pilin assembly protein TrbC